VPQEEPTAKATIMQMNMKMAGRNANGMLPAVVLTRNPAVPNDPETVPRVTARARMMAPRDTPFTPSTKPSMTSGSFIPLMRARTMAERTQRTKASLMGTLTVPVAR
jgi:hypothetical protein